jgi:pSer/pThr/pTyr-binding forkhead associated (FHA) protein
MDAVEKTIAVTSANATLMGVPVKCPVCETENSPAEKYCGECGFLLSSTPGEAALTGSEAKLTDASGTQEYYLKEGENVVGRENADVLISDPTVSRRHAVVIVEGGKYLVKDFGSTNGTFVGGKQIAGDETAELPNGGEVKFGSAVLTLIIPEVVESATDQTTVLQTMAEEESETQTEESVVEEETAVAYLVSESDPSVKFPIRRGLNTVGRRSSNAVVLTGDAYVSGSHAELTADETGVRLVDIGSTNGTLLNGTPVKMNESMAVAPNDEITFGQTKLKLEMAEDRQTDEE